MDGVLHIERDKIPNIVKATPSKQTLCPFAAKMVLCSRSILQAKVLCHPPPFLLLEGFLHIYSFVISHEYFSQCASLILDPIE